MCLEILTSCTVIRDNIIPELVPLDLFRGFLNIVEAGVSSSGLVTYTTALDGLDVFSIEMT
jgi:hypothetical protein